MNFIENSFKQADDTLSQFMVEENYLLIQKAVKTFVDTFKNNSHVYSCGNGGSMCDSLHFAEELTGRYRKDRSPLAATGISDAGHITCVANDFGYDHIFSRYLEAWVKPGDALLAISTSGNSNNIIMATETAKKNGAKVIGLLGKDGGKLKDLVDIPLIVPSMITDRIQEIHIKIIHIIIEGIERSLFPENY